MYLLLRQWIVDGSPAWADGLESSKKWRDSVDMGPRPDSRRAPLRVPGQTGRRATYGIAPCRLPRVRRQLDFGQ
jgi:hypothetical protein